MLNAKARRGKDEGKKSKNKEQNNLAVRMARAGGISISRALEFEGLLTEILAEGLLRDGQVAFNGFGRLEIVTRSEAVWDPRRRKMVERKMRRAVRWRGSDLTQSRGDAEEGVGGLDGEG